MNNFHFSISRVALSLLAFVLLLFILITGKQLIVPMIFGLMFAFMLLPISTLYERFIPYRPISVLLSFLTIIIPIIGLIFLFAFQVQKVFVAFPTIIKELESSFTSVLESISEAFPFPSRIDPTWMRERILSSFDSPIVIVGEGISLSAAALAGLLLSLLFAFFFLLYRTSFKNFILYQVDRQQREAVNHMINKIQSLIQRYLLGIGIVIVILSVLNSIGLLFIGIEYAFFWGISAAFLAIVPYIGTTLGGTLPFLYAIATTDNYWQPAAVVLMYAGIQQIEGNFITPFVVGGSVKVNLLTAITSLIFFGWIWGVSGVILALPLIAIIKVICEHINVLRPVGFLLSDRLYEEPEKFEEDFDEDKYRFLKFMMMKKNRKNNHD